MVHLWFTQCCLTCTAAGFKMAPLTCVDPEQAWLELCLLFAPVFSSLWAFSPLVIFQTEKILSALVFQQCINWESSQYNLHSHCFIYLFIFRPRRATYRILVPQLGIKPMPRSLGAQSLNHWTTREVPTQTSLQDSSRLWEGKTRTCKTS